MSRMTKVAAVVAGTGALIAGGAGLASADAGAQGLAAASPGVGSGNVVQVPVHVPVNLCGNTINVIGLLNPAFGNTCVNADGGHDGGYGYGR
ncbi:chaplin [Streptomyces anulatus]|uniref:chaplin n=1 Tax=Streptomyces TaxID=1883 RepID=UPI001B382F8C|nr:chaplin [Streptomyces sp. C3-3]MBQ1118174.1 chaplin [Streptomyces sp. C3-3]